MAADPETHVFHEVQLWVNMPAATKMEAPSISSAHAGEKPILDRGHYSVEVIAGTIDGQTSPLATTQPTTVARIQTTGPGPITIDGIDPSWNAAIYGLQGTANVAGQTLDPYQTAVLHNDGDSIVLTSTGPGADLLLMTGEAIGEPVVMGGPYVMNTQEEIEQANADFAAGKFDNVTLASKQTAPVDNSNKSILARGCDPVASLGASKAIPPLIGNPEYVPTSDDAEFIELLKSRKWSVVFFAPGACRFSVATQPIPGGNAGTQGWTLEQYRELVREYQGDQIQIVETLSEAETVSLLDKALNKAQVTH